MSLLKSNIFFLCFSCVTYLVNNINTNHPSPILNTYPVNKKSAGIKIKSSQSYRTPKKLNNIIRSTSSKKNYSKKGVFSTLPNPPCINRFTSMFLKSISFDSFTCAIATKNKELVTAGNIIDDNGFVSRFSTEGTPLFSYQYNPVYPFNRSFFSNLQFKSIFETKDGSYILSGSVMDHKVIIQGQIEYYNRNAVLLKIDSYGNIIWSQRFESRNSVSNSGFEISMTNAIETESGDIIAYMAADYGLNYAGFGKIVCFTANGEKKWSTLLATNDYDGGLPALNAKRSMMQIKNGAIVVGDIIYKSDRSKRPQKTLAAALHIFSIDIAGKIGWEVNYQLPLINEKEFSNVTSSFELLNKNLVFTVSSFQGNNSSNSGLRVVTNERGVILTGTQYHSGSGTSLELADGTIDPINGNQTYLFKNVSADVITNVNETGNIIWQKGLNNSNGQFPVNCFAPMNNGYGILESNFLNRTTRLLLTDTSARIDCANVPAQILSESVVLNSIILETRSDIADANTFGNANFIIKIAPNPFVNNIECVEHNNCCHLVVDSSFIPNINICEGDNYSLPDHTNINQGGTYFVVYKTPAGCDSIRYYDIKVNKNPKKLSLGMDVCMDGNDSIKLHATSGYEIYNWMNFKTSDSSFTIFKPGKYWVKVDNFCGSKTDTIEVFKTCDGEIFMPNSFTPNDDGINDKFGFSHLNKLRFFKLNVYNRIGQLIFSSSDMDKKWDGNFRSEPQPSGVYIYILELEDLSGKKVFKKGNVTLIR